MNYNFVDRPRAILTACVCLLLGGTGGAFAAPYVVLGASDGLAFDQPRVAVEVIDVSNPNNPRSLGPEFSNDFLLDTGASSILAVGPAASQLIDAGYETVAVYHEQGVAGFTEMGISESYRFDFAGTFGIRSTLNDVRMLSNTDLNFGSFGGIVGMPAMVNRSVALDLTPLGDIDYIQVEFPEAPFAPAGTRFRAPLTMLSFPQHGQVDPNDPLPIDAPLPLVNVEVRNRGLATGRQFLLDTGAQISIISTQTAAALGIDVEAETVDYLEVGGIGGTVLMPIVPVDRLGLVGADGTKLFWTDLQLGVLDIDPGIPGQPAISGVFGMDFLTSGWLAALFGELDSGFVRQIHFDFRNASQMLGEMLLDIDPDLYVVQYEGDVNHDGVVDIFDANMVSDHWLESGPVGDINGDGIVDIFDINIVSDDWTVGGAQIAAANVPEPASVLLLIVAATAAWLARRSIAAPR